MSGAAVTLYATLATAFGPLMSTACRRDRTERGARAQQPNPLLVLAATSLSDVLASITREFEAASGTAVRLSFGASSLLARQIIAGAPADVFVSADDVAMDDVERAGLLVPGARRPWASNRLVVVVGTLAADANAPNPEATRKRPSALVPRNPGDLVRVRRLALGDPATVPVGRYARRWLEALGLWDELKDRVIFAVNARATLAAVESGGADAAIVYRSDALVSRRVRMVFEASGPASPTIAYPVAPLARSTHPARDRFVAGLFAPGSRAALVRYGFEPLSP